MSPYCALSMTKPMLCVGGMSVDIVEQCETGPWEGEKLRSVETRWQRGGHASNVSFVLRLLGAQVEFFGVLSRSSMLRDILIEMERNGIDLSHCPRTDENPAFTTVINVRKTGCRTILQCSRNFPYVTIEDFRKLDLSLYGWVHFEARNKLDIIPMIRAILDYNNGRTDRIQISLKVDSCYKENIDLFDMCDYLIFSRELALDLGWQSVQETCLQLDKVLPLPYSINVRRPCIICSWGPLGAGCLDNKGKYYELAASTKQKAKDTYGVGECFTAAIIYALYVREMSLADAVALGNRVAGHKATSSGYNHIATLDTYPVTLTNVIEHRSENVSEDDAAENVICRKFMNRIIQPSDGKLATKLLQRFDRSNYGPAPAVKDSSSDSEPDLHKEPTPEPMPSSSIRKSGYRLSNISRKSVQLRVKRLR